MIIAKSYTFPSFLLCVFLVSLLCGCARLSRMVSKPSLPSEAIEKIDSLCSNLVEKKKAPGVVLLIGQGDKVLYKNAYGCRMIEPKSEAMTEDTIFDMASVTKATSTASAVMFLVQDGRISLDDSIAKYVPEFKEAGKEDITILSLLTHSSGLPAYTSIAYLKEHCGPGPNPDALIKRIAELDRIGAVGEKYVYSCLNYLTLARMVQNVIGGNMSDFLKERLWKPLGMKDTTFYPTEAQIERTAPTIYVKDGEFRRGMVHDPLANYSVCESYAPGNAGMFSTAEDLSRYTRMILDNGKWHGKPLFKPEIWEAITTNKSPETIDVKRSCGWGLWSDDCYATSMNQQPETYVLGHTGYTGTLIWMDKLSKAYVIFLSNCVYPKDAKKSKDATIAARRDIIDTVLDNLAIYKDVRE